MFVIIWFAIALLFAFVTSSMARRRGRDVITWGILGFLFGFIPMLILLVSGRAKTATAEIAYSGAAAPALARLQELEKLKNLLDSGAITQQEFDTLKKKLLG